MSSEEGLTGELVRSELSTAQLKAAVAEASGRSRADTARIAGVSASTIKAWRNRDDYLAEVERMKGVLVAQLEGPITELRSEVVEGARAAVRTLIDQLDAVDARDRPQNSIRQRAAETLLQYGIELASGDADAKASQAAGGPAPQIHINVGDRPPPTAADLK